MADDTVCSIPGCCNPLHARGWCNQHYKRWRSHGDPEKAVIFPITLSFEGRYPTQKELCELLDYSSETGLFRWKERLFLSRLTAGWNKRFAGKIAGRQYAEGYISICIGNRGFLAHRLAMIYVYGDSSAHIEMVDHINGDAGDNRINNLRAATNSQNQANQKIRVKPKWPGMPKGVQPHANGRFRSQIRVKGKIMYLGYYATADEAHAAYMKAAKDHFSQFARAK